MRVQLDGEVSNNSFIYFIHISFFAHRPLLSICTLTETLLAVFKKIQQQPDSKSRSDCFTDPEENWKTSGCNTL